MPNIPETEKRQKFRRIHAEIQNNPGIHTPELAERLGIPERTLRDYLIEMVEKL